MKIYILTSGPSYEGATLTRAFKTRERATEEGLKAEPDLGNGPWKLIHESLPDYWESEMYWMQVREYELEE